MIQTPEISSAILIPVLTRYCPGLRRDSSSGKPYRLEKLQNYGTGGLNLSSRDIPGVQGV